MDSRSFNINTARELNLRRHIREVLLPYVRTHLTSDHVTFTEMTVEELLLQTLEYVPMADATAFLLPTEPFEVLVRSLDSYDLALPEEKWVTPSEHCRYLRTLVPPASRPQDLQTEKCWLEDDHYTKLLLLCKPLSTPILSRRSKRETPNLGGTLSRMSIPRTRSALATFLDFRPVAVQNMDDLQVPPLDDVLDLRVKLDSTTAVLARSLLRSVSVLPKRGKLADSSGDTPHVPEFLRHDSPSRCPPRLDSPPLFPWSAKHRSTHRNARADKKSRARNPIRVSDLASMLKGASPELIDGEDGDINDHHMEIVNGWSTLRFSSPPPPPQHSSDGSELDELWDVSPPGTPATSLMAAKMDEVEIPRVRKFGHKNTLVNKKTNDSGAATLLTVANSPGFFITSFISAPIPMPQTQKPVTSQVGSVELGMRSPRHLSPGPSTSNSLLGQPPSPPDGQANVLTSIGPVDYLDDQELDDTVASIYASTQQDPLSYILEEKLDDKDMMLMDVPDLPPRRGHSKHSTLFPEGIRCFVAPKGEPGCLDTTSHQGHTASATAFLQPVKGIKPLALDLSWRPFNFGKTIPIDDEVAGIGRPIQPDAIEVLGYRDEKFEKTVDILLSMDTPPISAEDAELTLIPTRGCEEFGTSPTPKRTEESIDVEYLLTRRERMRASGVRSTFDGEPEVQDNVNSEQGISPWPRNDRLEDVFSRHENTSHHEEHQDLRDLFDPVPYHSRDQTSHDHSFDNSGIDIGMVNALDQFSTGEFGVPLLLQPLQNDLPHSVDNPRANEHVDDQSEDKENVPPENVDDYSLDAHQPNSLESQYDWNGYFHFPESESFEPLSFLSQDRRLATSDDLANSKVQDEPPLTPSASRAKRPEDHPVSTSECEPGSSRVTKRRKLDNLVPASSKDLFSAFIGLRNKTTSRDRALEHAEIRNDTSTPHDALDTAEKILPRGTPDDVFDQYTVRLPEPWMPAVAIHRYLASMALIQKRALVRELQGHLNRVNLVERYDLGGVDIIVDPDSSVLLISLLALPAQLEPTAERICRESWRYLHLLVVLEAFPGARSYRADRSRNNGPLPYAYTPPVCKAIKKLRRYLGIAEGCDTLNPRCTISWAFANDVEEAAKFVRCFGEEAYAISKERGCEILWDERGWLEEEERDGESDLARVQGMNAFAAFVMLYDTSLDTILDLSPEARLADFGRLLGEERMTALNAVIESRKQQIATDTTGSAADPGS